MLKNTHISWIYAWYESVLQLQIIPNNQHDISQHFSHSPNLTNLYRAGRLYVHIWTHNNVTYINSGFITCDSKIEI